MNQATQTTHQTIARTARYENGLLHLTLGGGALEGTIVAFPTRGIGPLSRLSEAQLAQVKIVSGGGGLMWREADVDISVAGLIERVTGLRTQRTHLQTIGSARSEAKSVAARANGAKGGRPRKSE